METQEEIRLDLVGRIDEYPRLFIINRAEAESILYYRLKKTNVQKKRRKHGIFQ
jgi:hypothetical protein